MPHQSCADCVYVHWNELAEAMQRQLAAVCAIAAVLDPQHLHVTIAYQWLCRLQQAGSGQRCQVQAPMMQQH